MSTKKQSFVYNVILCGAMTYIMGIVNMSINMSVLNRLSIWIATKNWPITFLFGLIIATFIIYPIANLATFHFVSSNDSNNSKIMFMSFFMVCGMSMCMSLFKAVMINGVTNISAMTFLENWPRNFCIALFIQLIFVGPFARKVLGLILKINSGKSN